MASERLRVSSIPMASMMSPSTSPALSAGEPGIDGDDRRVAVALGDD
jgi:hypothetical protein